MTTNRPEPNRSPVPPPPASPPTEADAVRRTSSDALLAGADELVIEHRGAEYRLRLTALGKLILTK